LWTCSDSEVTICTFLWNVPEASWWYGVTVSIAQEDSTYFTVIMSTPAPYIESHPPMTYLDLVQCDHSTAVDSFWLCHFWSSLVFHTFAQYLCDVKYFTFNIKARDRKSIPAVTIPQVEHH